MFNDFNQCCVLSQVSSKNHPGFDYVVSACHHRTHVESRLVKVEKDHTLKIVQVLKFQYMKWARRKLLSVYVFIFFENAWCSQNQQRATQRKGKNSEGIN